MLGKGRAEAITPAHMAAMADEIGCHPADLEAISRVESGGFGWFADGRIKILPEPHKFYSELPKDLRTAALNAGLATRSYKGTKASGHYKRMSGPAPRYALLQRMIAFNRRAAFRAMSVGSYQIMGFNAELCGFADAEAMFNAFCDSEVNQLRAVKTFLLKKGLKGALQRGDFDRIELKYNGGGLNGAYAKRMRAEAAKLRKGKWKDYRPGSMAVPVPVAPGPVMAPEPVMVEDVNMRSTGIEKTGAAAGAVVTTVGAGLAAAWQSGLWVLVSVIGAVLTAFIIWRVLKRR